MWWRGCGGSRRCGRGGVVAGDLLVLGSGPTIHPTEGGESDIRCSGPIGAAGVGGVVFAQWAKDKSRAVGLVWAGVRTWRRRYG